MHSILTHKKKRPDDDDVIPEAIREREKRARQKDMEGETIITRVCVCEGFFGPILLQHFVHKKGMRGGWKGVCIRIRGAVITSVTCV